MEKINKNVIWGGIYWLIGIVLYFPYISDFLPNPDTIWNGVYYKEAYRQEIGAGRWGIKVIQDIRGGVINSSFVTLAALFFLAIIAILITEIFKVEGQ